MALWLREQGTQIMKRRFSKRANTPVPDLPYELWDQIVGEVSATSTSEIPSKRYGLPIPLRYWLRNLCLVNSTFREVASTRLYRSIVLRKSRSLKALYVSLLRNPQWTSYLQSLCLYGDASSQCPSNMPTLIAFFTLPGLPQDLRHLVIDRTDCKHYPQCWESTERFRNVLSPVLDSLNELVLLGHHRITTFSHRVMIEPATPIGPPDGPALEPGSSLVKMSSFMHWQHFHALQRLLLYRPSVDATLVSFLSQLPHLTNLILVNSDILSNPHPNSSFLIYVKEENRQSLKRLVVLTPTNTWKFYVRALGEVAGAAGPDMEVQLLHPEGLWDKGGVSIDEKLGWIRDQVEDGTIWERRAIPIAP